MRCRLVRCEQGFVPGKSTTYACKPALSTVFRGSCLELLLMRRQTPSGARKFPELMP